MLSNKEIENLEYKYLGKINSVLDHHLDDIIEELESMNKISKYWAHIPYDNGFDSGAERVIYSKLHSGGLGTPNSSPVASDLFFENKETFIHIDLKSSQPNNNLSDHWRIPVGVNQNSFSNKMKIKNKPDRNYLPNLPTFYDNKVCLTYFITILYINIGKNFHVLNINTSCMPNGKLLNVYKDTVLAAGKNPKKITKTGSVEKAKARFKTNKCNDFLLLKNKKRVKIAYINKDKLKLLPEHIDWEVIKGENKGKIEKKPIKKPLRDFLKKIISLEEE